MLHISSLIIAENFVQKRYINLKILYFCREDFVLPHSAHYRLIEMKMSLNDTGFLSLLSIYKRWQQARQEQDICWDNSLSIPHISISEQMSLLKTLVL